MITLESVGRQLRELRRVKGLAAEEVALRVGVSRALLYRYEAGEVVKLATLERFAELYGTTPQALLGLRNDYYTDGLAFFEKVLALEAGADQVLVVFGPIPYLLTSDAYDESMRQALLADGQHEEVSAFELARAQRVLRRRKDTYHARRPPLTAILPVSEIRHFLAVGFNRTEEGTAAERAARRRAAAREVQHLAGLIERPALGLQIGLTDRPLPTAGFQLLKLGSRKVVTTSPFRIGPPFNMRYGVAMVSEDPAVVALYEDLAQRLWETSLKGQDAVAVLRNLGT